MANASSAVFGKHGGRHDDHLRVTAFRAFCQTHGLQIETSTDLDQALVEWFDVLFFEGWGADTGTKAHDGPRLRFLVELIGMVNSAVA